MKYFFLWLSHFGFSQNHSETIVYFENILNLNFQKNYHTSNFDNFYNNNYFYLLNKIIEDDRQTELFSLDQAFVNFKIENSISLTGYVSNLINGYIFLNYTKNRAKSYSHFKQAYDISKNNKYNYLEKYSLFFLLKFYLKGSLQGNNNYEEYLKLFKKQCKTEVDWLYYFSFKFNFLSQTQIYSKAKYDINEDYRKIFKSYDSLIFNSKRIPKKNLAIYYKDKANFVIRDNPKLAEKYYIKASEYYTTAKYFKFEKFYNFINLSRVAYSLKKYTKALNYLNEATKYKSFNDSLFDAHDIAIFKADCFNKLNKNDSAYFYEKKARNLGYLINFQEENLKVSELEVQLKTEKKEKENLQLKSENQTIEAKRKQNLNLLILVIFLSVLGFIIYLLILNNSKKKRKLIAQQKELEVQKNYSLLKEQEILAINAMVSGQEKERKRIAEDLHDNIGSVLATLKLHFENLKLNREKKQFNQEELYAKTEKLIDETYTKIRKIAHTENAGTIGNKGLLLAVKLMTEKIASLHNITIEVTDFGLNKPLENELELTIFRISQELVTNILKHAKAKNIQINISQFEDQFSLIVEDDGVGFDQRKIDFKNSMGLASIKTRVNHLDGKLKIDSTQGKGTAILITIPLH